MEKLTIQQIADLAGVNKATVSRVINGNSSISEKTRLKIEKIMKQHNYVPNSIARGLAFNKTFTVGFCFDYTDKQAYANPFFYKVLQGIEEIVYEQDHLFLMMSDHQQKKNNKSTFERVVGEHRVDGLIIPNTLLNEQNYNLLLKHKMPYVVSGENLLQNEGGVPWVDIDNIQAGRILTEHLIDIGCRHIVIYAGKGAVERDKFIVDRLEGYTQAMNRKGMKVKVIDNPDVLRTLNQEVDANLKGDLQHPDALICCTHEQLFQVLDWDHGNPVLSEMALATFDNFPISRYMKYPIHFVEIDLEMMGKQAAQMLFRLMNKEEGVNPSISIQTRIGNT
ncbi:DNA-binding LacI/PurR family transcriptional regulator [Paenibacillus sp. DS2015]|uniref:LacI family DNA-binding transcriptional regulator n=1 Tax=Paenibacillus sp. DS2015 TaxID=3373917 RepID=UPI003D2149A7